MHNQSMGWCSSVGCDSFRDEKYGDVKKRREITYGEYGNNVRGVSYGYERYGDVTIGTYCPCIEILDKRV